MRPDHFRFPLHVVAALGAVVLLAASCSKEAPPTAPEDPLPPGWLAGRVIDDTGAPLPGVRVAESTGGPAATTGADGTFRIGPFAEGDTVVLVTETPDTVSAPGADDAWYDVTTLPLPVDAAPPLAITLLTRYAIEIEGQASWLPDHSHFSHFLEFSTSTLGSASGPSITWAWPVPFPLKVLVRDSTIVHSTDAGDVTIDAGACLRTAMARWNAAAGREMLVETHDPAAAQVTTAYPVLGRTKVAQCRPSDPDSCGFRTCPPLTVALEMSSVHIPDTHYFTDIATHELGHALGFWGHISDSREIVEGGQALHTCMGSAGGTTGAHIHPLEVKAIIARSHISSGTALEQYEGTAPWYADFPPVPTDGGTAR